MADTIVQQSLSGVEAVNTQPDHFDRMMQLLPNEYWESSVLKAIFRAVLPELEMLIAVAKDVEGVNPANIGNIVFGRRSLVPCTALAVMEMIESTGVEIRGSRAVCVGASTIVGKPVAVLLMQAEATVISTNIHTKNCDDLMRSADILVSAAGVPNLITADVVKDGAVVIDVGINRIVGDDGNKRTVGDVDFSAVKNMAGYISPVPGGVGPMTVAMLLRNTVQAAETTS